MNKENYINFAKQKFQGEALNLVLHNIELFFKNEKQHKNKYNIGDYVKLEKGTYMHGIPGMLENFNWVINNGLIANDFTQENFNNKIKYSIGMWVIQENCLLKDYIKKYSGFTITYTVGRGPGAKHITKLVPYHKFDEETEKLNNNDEVWMYFGEQTKEIRFMPSLVAEKRQIAFILNTKSSYAKQIIRADVWNTDLEEETLKSFLDYRYYEKFLQERLNRTAQTTNRESSIIFGMPISLVEGVLVGRKLEKDEKSLKYIKSKLPNCYICNLDGKVIVK